jgi:sulfoxide reductase heme-binding subunit YedZ
MKDPRFAKFVVLVNGGVPAAMLCWDASHQQLGADPANRAIHVTGMTALVFLVLTLAVTPVRKITGRNWLSHFRRMLGLYAFFYALVHFSIYFWIEKSLNVQAVIDDTARRPFILFGMTALLLMIPLAATSTNGIIKSMGAARWKMLHRLIYICGIAAVTHYAMFGKISVAKMFQDFTYSPQPTFIVIFAVLLGYRIFAGSFRGKTPAANARPAPQRDPHNS